ncbi:arabinofuranosidase catalytic domain-containing protein [Micromonospora sp. NPDC051925]|uniref:arabinofuranosidase catalytic domain-containing protein n=1 Tax=Micromonospora sp. NPDC051925 TaxID=3364288 RepID=UPI0037C8C892
MTHGKVWRRLAGPVAALAALVLIGSGAVGTPHASAAAAGCQVDYTVSSEWPGGFGANVTITDLGDPVSSWQLTWSFGASQTITQLWNGSYTQSGAQVTVTNVSYNGSIPTGGNTSFGFNGSWAGSNPVPTSFALNGTTCTGGVTPTTTPGTPPSTPPPTTPGTPPPTTPPATRLPCDIYAAGNTPCVAAHSTTRALYSAYNGNLYQVRRASDNATRNIGPLTAGGVANAAAQDSFCAGTTCLITIIYDQSGRGNHLTQAPPGGFSGPAAGGYDNLANATAAPTTVNGQKAYGVFVAPGTGYRNNNTNGVATGDQPEGMYAIFDGTHYNGGCCFDYGNAERNSRDNGNGTMEAIYFGNIKVWGYGTGNGPWIMADLENGLFSGVNTGYNANDPSISHRYLTAIVKGEANHWAIRGGNAQSGNLSTFYNGKRPNASGYNPMKKEGAIILGIGGDNSHGSAGTFYEGVMTSGYPSDATEEAVQANIVSAGYR